MWQISELADRISEIDFFRPFSKVIIKIITNSRLLQDELRDDPAQVSEEDLLHIMKIFNDKCFEIWFPKVAE